MYVCNLCVMHEQFANVHVLNEYMYVLNMQHVCKIDYIISAT